MNKHNILYGIAGLLLGLIIGFLVANNVAQRGYDSARTQPANTSSSNQNAGNANAASTADKSRESLSDEEIRAAIAKTDARPDDVSLQKDFGIALYKYSTQTQNEHYLPDVARFLKRAYEANPKDRELLLNLANVLFDIGQTSDPARFSEAREYYLKALQMNPDDVDAHTDLGLTYYLGKPSDPQRAIAEYRKSLRLNPKDERALQSLASALISTGNHDEAQKRIEELKSINPNNPALSNLRAQLAQSKNAAAQE